MRLNMRKQVTESPCCPCCESQATGRGKYQQAGQEECGVGGGGLFDDELAQKKTDPGGNLIPTGAKRRYLVWTW